MYSSFMLALMIYTLRLGQLGMYVPFSVHITRTAQ